MSNTVTRDIRIQVECRYVPQKSNPMQGRYFFAYRVTLTNEGTETVQLISRHWRITDANGNLEEVQGPGVVGKQPVLAPGASFEYISACPLPTPIGSMQGTYQMVTHEGDTFDAVIAPFTLAEPYAFN